MYWLVLLHTLGATVWTGGHLVLAIGILPKALKDRDPELITRFENRYERIGIPALLLQVVTGIELARRFFPGFEGLLDTSNPLARAVLVKFALLATTVLLAIDARLRLIPRLSAETLPSLAWHIVPVTFLSVAFVAVGIAVRFGGL
ncbi:CopD family protein [Nibricoccus sp. IMCC34717]|uniref:CopD family protein n=1 Tax=Nibricoccus sp. IMCC34717 TaxID=3034021 RepID=UPI00384C15E3